MSLLLPQNRAGVVRAVRTVDLHGDRYLDLAIELDGAPGPPVLARLGSAECPPGLAAGERVVARFTMGVIVRLVRED